MSRPVLVVRCAGRRLHPAWQASESGPPSQAWHPVAAVTAAVQLLLRDVLCARRCWLHCVPWKQCSVRQVCCGCFCWSWRRCLALGCWESCFPAAGPGSQKLCHVAACLAGASVWRTWGSGGGCRHQPAACPLQRHLGQPPSHQRCWEVAGSSQLCAHWLLQQRDAAGGWRPAMHGGGNRAAVQVPLSGITPACSAWGQ